MNKNARWNRFCANNGFTLIELLVVVLIIGILAAVAVPQYQKAVEKARAAEALSVMASITQAIDVWVLENGYPTNGVQFVGTENTTKGELLVDLESALGCTYEEGECASKFFSYVASCGAGGCVVSAFRQSDTNYYFLHLFKSSEGTIEKSCWADADDHVAPCCSLAAQGWKPMDEEMGTAMEC